MNHIYNIGHCPVCNNYGIMEILFDKVLNKCIVMCDECCLEFSCINDYQNNINGHRTFFNQKDLPDLPIVRPATLDEIKNTEWYPFIKF